MSITKDEEIIKRGYRPNPKIYIPDSNIIKTVNKLEELEFVQTDYGVSRMKLRDSLYDAKQFLDYYYNLHNVPYLFFKKIGNINFHTIINRHPYKLPIIPTISDETIFDGATIEEITHGKKPKVIFRGIELNKVVTECSSATYVHELTHTQVDSIKGSIRNYYNAEILSIFNELFHYMILGGDERLLRLTDSRRVCELNLIFEDLINFRNGTSSMTRDELLEDSKYAVSILKAYNLFITFYYSNEKIKNEILDDIQCVFDGYLTLEEMLKKYEVTLESSKDEKKLLKYFNR